MQLKTFEERFEYLKLNGSVGVDTFGFDRYINQTFYRSTAWKKIRDIVIVRDNACDLGMLGYELHDKIYIHHMNPITVKDIVSVTEYLTNPEYLICVSFSTHNAIHYSSDCIRKVERKPNDMCPWKK